MDFAVEEGSAPAVAQLDAVLEALARAARTLELELSAPADS